MFSKCLSTTPLEQWPADPDGAGDARMLHCEGCVSGVESHTHTRTHVAPPQVWDTTRENGGVKAHVHSKRVVNTWAAEQPPSHETSVAVRPVADIRVVQSCGVQTAEPPQTDPQQEHTDPAAAPSGAASPPPAEEDADEEAAAAQTHAPPQASAAPVPRIASAAQPAARRRGGGNVYRPAFPTAACVAAQAHLSSVKTREAAPGKGRQVVPGHDRPTSRAGLVGNLPMQWEQQAAQQRRPDAAAAAAADTTSSFLSSRELAALRVRALGRPAASAGAPPAAAAPAGAAAAVAPDAASFAPSSRPSSSGSSRYAHRPADRPNLLL